MRESNKSKDATRSNPGVRYPQRSVSRSNWDRMDSALAELFSLCVGACRTGGAVRQSQQPVSVWQKAWLSVVVMIEEGAEVGKNADTLR